LTHLIQEGRIAGIPVLRENPKKETPIFFGSDGYINMNHENWQGEPLTNLVEAIQRLASEQSPLKSI
jgi:hypothetical protein